MFLRFFDCMNTALLLLCEADVFSAMEIKHRAVNLVEFLMLTLLSFVISVTQTIILGQLSCQNAIASSIFFITG